MAARDGAGVNLVSLGVFAWASLEPEPGEYEFGWLDEVMDLLHENGIAVNLATPTAAPPAWLTHRHPEVLPVMADGERFGFGNRLHYDPSSPIYREHLPRGRRARPRGGAAVARGGDDDAGRGRGPVRLERLVGAGRPTATCRRTRCWSCPTPTSWTTRE
ncbi:beta-galactosidase [Microbispora bryophytorum]|uniref:beta-galactosidase n=1 Tax=Microbispora bryophytorum TaxID=1460882 RepID=UPI00371709A8